MLPVPTRDELVTFTGRPASAFSTFADQALAQATLMFTFVTHLAQLPPEPDKVQLATYAILEMADRILLEQPWAAYKNNPFQSETIGSWSYSKSTATVRTVQQGMRTGLFWWDLAVDELSTPGTSVAGHGSIAADTPGLAQLDDGSFYISGPDGEDDSSAPYTRIS